MDLILEGLGYTTARVVLPAVTFNGVKVDTLLRGDAGFNWLGFKRLADGTLLCDSTSAGWIGALLWLFALVAVFALV